MILSRSALRQVKEAASPIRHFARWFIGITLRPYQLEAAEAIVDSVLHRKGLTFIIIFSRQSGKDEMLAVLFLYLMLRLIEIGADMVCAQPTFKPQTVNAMERIKKRGANFGRRLRRTAGYIMQLGQARTAYFSAEPSASQVGATGERLMVMNEAQDILPDVYDKRFSPWVPAATPPESSATQQTIQDSCAEIKHGQCHKAEAGTHRLKLKWILESANSRGNLPSQTPALPLKAF